MPLVGLNHVNLDGTSTTSALSATNVPWCSGQSVTFTVTVQPPPPPPQGKAHQPSGKRPTGTVQFHIERPECRSPFILDANATASLHYIAWRGATASFVYIYSGYAQFAGHHRCAPPGSFPLRARTADVLNYPTGSRSMPPAHVFVAAGGQRPSSRSPAGAITIIRSRQSRQ